MFHDRHVFVTESPAPKKMLQLPGVSFLAAHPIARKTRIVTNP